MPELREWRVALSLLLALGMASVAAHLAAEDAVSDGDLGAWVDQKVQARQPPAADRRFDDIGWARDIRHALKLAKEHNRPVFLFTHDGRMNLGRC